ncbi:hypothetical protein H2198_003634 [Neophaeococcomyces mojaviensis]|uniref:Uncharacterized protein n=1 Tax=Neophaeococcomyces mojaviensis TaxID=3383035 RepID=A0ACC3AAT5_9EURO|nr:hypothetical protein H2198_003634 [Knufia sp. JES_112]
MEFSKAPELVPYFTLHVELSTPYTIGSTLHGERRFIPITGGIIDGPQLKGKILPGGGDWNLVQPNGIVHLMAKYTISLVEEDGSETLVTITNEGIGRASREVMDGVFHAADPSSFSSGRMGGSEDAELGENEHDLWYTRTTPRFDVRTGSKYEYLCRSLWLVVLKPPQKQGEVVINVFQVC